MKQTPEVWALSEKRGQIGDAVWRDTARVCWISGIVIVLFGVLASFADAWDSVQTGLVTMLVLAVAVYGSLFLGIWISRLAPEHQRGMVHASWVRELWLLHVPWLVDGVFTALGVVFVLVAGDSDLSAMILIFFGLWVITVFSTGVVWLVRMREYTTKYRVDGSGFALAMLYLNGVVWWVAMVMVGFWGGILGAWIISRAAGDSFLF